MGVVRAAVGVVRAAVGQVRGVEGGGARSAGGLEASRPESPGETPGPAGEDEVPPSPSATPAARFLDALADRLAVGVASVVAILDPGCVVLGGEVGQAGGEELAGRVRDRIARMTPLPTEVRTTTLGGDAVLRGALLTARDRAQEELFTPGERPIQRW